MLARVAGKSARRLRRYLRSFTATVNEAPVIVLGKEKSGTTAIASLLARHTGCSLAHDIQALWGPVERLIREGAVDFDDIVRRNRGKFGSRIIKEPTLTFVYAQVRRRFPGGRYVMIVRDPRDNIRSVFNRLGLPGTLPALDASALDRIPPAWREVIEGDSAGFTRATYIEVAARRWNEAADVYLAHRGDMMLIRYEDFVTQKAATIEHLARALDLPPVRDVSADVNVQYQRRGDRTVAWPEFFGGRNLAVIETICGARMREFGYEPAARDGGGRG